MIVIATILRIVGLLGTIFLTPLVISMFATFGGPTNLRSTVMTLLVPVCVAMYLGGTMLKKELS